MKTFNWVLIGITLAGCVSVNLPSQSGHKSKDVVYEQPPAPFSAMVSENADQAWISNKTGNTISFVSDCNNPTDQNLQQIENETLGVLHDPQILFSQNIIFNSREGMETLAQGKVDGVWVKMKLVTFKKNNCSYSLVFGGLRNKFDSEISYFNTFMKGFKAP